MTQSTDEKKQSDSELDIEELGTDETEEVAGGSCSACTACGGACASCEEINDTL